MKIWLDDVKPAPEGFVHCKSVNEGIRTIEEAERKHIKIELLDLDYDLGEYSFDGGDSIELLYWLCERQTFYPIELHTTDLVGMDYMRFIIWQYWPHNGA